MARYVRSGARGLGFELIEGVDFEERGELSSYPAVTGLRIHRGRLPAGPNELLVDRQRASDPEEIGASVELLGSSG